MMIIIIIKTIFQRHNHAGNNLVQTQSLDSGKQFLVRTFRPGLCRSSSAFWKANLTIRLLYNKSRSSLRVGCGKSLHEVLYFTYYHAHATGYPIHWEPRVLTKERHAQARKIKEAIAIQRLGPEETINQDRGIELSKLWADVLKP